MMSKTRTRVESTAQIKTLEEANAALAEIGLMTLKIEAIDGKAAQKIGEIKEKAALAGKSARDRISELENAMLLYAEYNKADLFRDKKSIPLSYGTIGFRLSTKISVKRTTLELLKKLFGTRGLRVKEEVDKDALKEWPDEELAQVDAAKVEQDTFFYEVNREEVNKDLMKAS